MEKSSYKELPQDMYMDSEISDRPKNTRDLEVNSKILDYQNKIIASASIGPYPIGQSVDPTITMKSIHQATEEADKKLKQRQYVKELEDQIKIRDQIKREEEMRKNKKLDAYQPDLEMPFNEPQVPVANNQISEPVSPKHSFENKDRRTLGSAPKAAAELIVGTDNKTDPFGGNIPIRRKIDNRIDQELESRGSIFSGRDEKSILIRKRNIQQQHMREELLRQIEEKKKREDDIKKRKMEEDLIEESRIKQELQKFESDNPSLGDTNKQSVPKYYQNKPHLHSTLSNSSYLPELSVKQQSEPLKESSPISREAEFDKQPHSSNNFETTAAFAKYSKNVEERIDNLPSEEEKISNLRASQSSKIQEMINQVDNKKALQDQISKRMDVKTNPMNGHSETATNGPVVGNQKLTELSDIVKKLLEEQRDLKSKLNERDNIIADLSKNNSTTRKNTQERERRTRSLKPEAASKKVGSADNKSLAARRLREKHSKDKERITAIEDKIEKARQRKAEQAKETSVKANKVGGLVRPNLKNRPSSDFDPKLYKAKNKTNRDLDEIEHTGYSDPSIKDLNVCKPRAVDSPSYSLSSKIDELNTQSRSKRSNYEYGNDSKGATSQKRVAKYSNIVPDYEDLELDDDNIQEEQAFMFSLPPDDDDNYSAYSLLGGQPIHRTPMTEFDALASEGGDQIDLLMNAYSRSNIRPVNMNSIPMSDLTTSMGINYSPNFNDMYVVTKDDNTSGFYQSGNFPSNNYPNARMQNPQIDQFYASGVQSNYNYPGYSNDQYMRRNNVSENNKVRQYSSKPPGAQMMTNNGKLIMSPGNRMGNNIMFMQSDARATGKK